MPGGWASPWSRCWNYEVANLTERKCTMWIASIVMGAFVGFLVGFALCALLTASTVANLRAEALELSRAVAEDTMRQALNAQPVCTVAEALDKD